MIEHFPFLLVLTVIIIMLTMLADKIKVAYPILLLIAGILISFNSHLPKIHIEPKMIFVIFLPPLLYEAAFAISWKELWKWRRVIGSLAFLFVFLTALSVAFVINWIMPEFSLALGFLLGGIVSPPDAVSAGAILKFVKLPKRISSIMEGESLLNDASSLIIFRFAIIAVTTGQFVWFHAVISFSWMVIGGIGIGLLIAWLFMKIHQIWPTDANMDIILTFVTPYTIYVVAESLESSGVLAVVSGGLFLSTRIHYFLNSSARLKAVNVWQSLIFLLNGFIFILIGLELPEIINGLKSEGIDVSFAISYGLIITTVLITVRFFASYAAVVVTKIASNFIEVADKNPGLKAPLIISWAGMRGVVSLAAALSIPVQLSNGEPFPHRNLILFITFTVILTTLVIQGLTLPWLIKKINLPEYGDYLPEEESQLLLKKELADFTLSYFKTNYKDQLLRNENLRSFFQILEKKRDSIFEPEMSEETKKIYLDILEQQRNWLEKISETYEKIDNETFRKFFYVIDLEEEKIKNKV